MKCWSAQLIQKIERPDFLALRPTSVRISLMIDAETAKNWRLAMEKAMNAQVRPNELRTRLNNLDQMLSRGNVRTHLRPIAAKVFEGEDAVFGSRG